MLEHTATRTLAAADLLWERGFPGDAASRYDYAMHQAAAARFAELGVAPGSLQSGAVRWEHATIANNTFRLRSRRDDRGPYTSVMKLRVQADSQETVARPDPLAARLPQIRSFVRELIP